MDENKTKFENIFDNLYIRAERTGTVKFDNDQDRETSKKEIMRLYKQYYNLISQRNRAYEKTKVTSYVGASRDQRKYIKQQNREGKREIKELNKQIAVIKKEIEDKTGIMFDIPGIGGIEQANRMIEIAYKEDLQEEIRREKQEDRAKKMESFCPKEHVNETKAIETTGNQGKEVRREDKEK